MRRVLKVLLGLLLAVVVLAGGAIGYLFAAFPKASEPSAAEVEPTEELRERGRYLAVHVTVCIDCHSERDWSRLSAPLVEGSEGKGGEKFGRELGFPGDIHTPNITPAGIGDYTDGELARVITEGVTRDGRALFPVMPYPAYAKLCQRDLDAIVVHVRGLAPIENRPPPTDLDFPMSLVVRTIPAPAPERPPCPDPSDQLAYGAYLVGIAACGDCHTKAVKGEVVLGMEFAGGFEFPLPSGAKVRSSNITPHETGLGKWDEASFVQRFKALASRPPPKVEKADFQTVMPWTLYGGMTDDDLKAIWAYLRTLRPVENTVERFTPPP